MVLKAIRNEIGLKQVAIGSLGFAPEWLLNKAIQPELDTNWKQANEMVLMFSIPQKASPIGSHFDFKVKDDEDGSLNLKARLVLHGHRDRDRYSALRDSASADLLIIHLILSLATLLDFNLVTEDVKGAYMQSDPIRRDLFFRPPKNVFTRHWIVWKSLRLL